MSDSDSKLSSAPSDVPEVRRTPASTRGVKKAESSIESVNGSKRRKRAAPEVETTPNRVKRIRKGPEPAYTEADEEEKDEHSLKSTPKKRRGTPKGKKITTVTKVKTEEIDFEDEESDSPVAKSPKKTKKKTTKGKTTIKEDTLVKEEVKQNGEVKTTVQRKRKTKEEKEAEAMPIAARTLGSKIVVGAHVSGAGGVHNAIVNSVYIGGNAFALFLKSQRKWENPALQNEHLTQFLSSCKEHSYGHPHHAIPPIVPHGSYLVNLAHPDPDRTKQAYTAFLDDLDRCRKLGIRLYNFHPGSAGASKSRDDAISHLADQLNKAHADPASGDVITLLETMAAGKNILGSTFEDLANTIDLVEKKDRVGVCLDTCHVFAAGYDLRSPEAFKDTMENFDKVIGLKYLKALHINDSKAPLNSGRDLHANIGTGFLGLRAFHNIVNEPRLWGLPMVLETPIDVKVKDEKTGKEKEVPDKTIWSREIKLMESMVGMDIEGEEFLQLEKELHEKGTAERERIQAQVDKAVEKKAKSEKKGGKKKGKKEESSEEESDD